MNRARIFLIALVALTFLKPSGVIKAEDDRTLVRGILVKPNRITPEFLSTWKEKGATAIVVPLDESTGGQWKVVSEAVRHAGMELWPWVEVARNPSMADAHPDWMAAIGAHHDDWRRDFPRAPMAKAGEVIKVWPWVPIGYAQAYDAHLKRAETLLKGLPGSWSGVFLNDLQGGPSSCGCGNNQCRWAIDYGAPATTTLTPGDDAAARIVGKLRQGFPGRKVIPVWVTECEVGDLPNVAGGTGLCGSVPCAKGACWPHYVRNWNPLTVATSGPIALALWSETFHRNPERWVDADLNLFQAPPSGNPIESERIIAVVQAWKQPEAVVKSLLEKVNGRKSGWVLALDPIDQSWEPRAVIVPRS
jgi:hypothetical protein